MFLMKLEINMAFSIPSLCTSMRQSLVLENITKIEAGQYYRGPFLF